MSTNILCLALVLKPGLGDVERWIAASLGLYHLWPCHRAFARLTRRVPGDVDGQGTLGGPALHLGIHIVLFVLFAYVALFGREI